ncbi:MAG: hypothetical protein HYV59_03100 [Planctomycetes bacterium]|nr:hypothetical protein [Planctomycetota bacterium]
MIVKTLSKSQCGSWNVKGPIPIMMTAKAKIVDDHLFEKVKAHIKPFYYVECCLCRSIKVDAKELARALDSLIDYSDNANEELTEFASEFLGKIIEPARPALGEFWSSEEFQKWESENEHRTYHFLDPDNYEYAMYGKYDEIVIFYDTTCNCFSKGKIKDAIAISY